LCGNDGIAAYGVIANIAIVVLEMFNGVAQGMQPLVSRYHGKGGAEVILRYALVSVTLLSTVVYGTVFVAAEPIAMLFNSENNAVMQRLAVHGMKWYFTGCLFAGVNIVLSAYLIASDRPRPANVCSIMRGFAVIIPATLLLSTLWGVTGLWLAFPLTEGLVAAVGGIVMMRVGKSPSQKDCVKNIKNFLLNL
jgi:Na+-driven multidrug efflux pump